MIHEYASFKIASTIGGAVGAFAAIVAGKTVSKVEAYLIASVGIFLAFMVPTLIARSVILKYNLTHDFDTILGISGILGLLFGLLGYLIIGGIYEIGKQFKKSPIPFLTKLLGIFGKDK